MLIHALDLSKCRLEEWFVLTAGSRGWSNVVEEKIFNSKEEADELKAKLENPRGKDFWVSISPVIVITKDGQTGYVVAEDPVQLSAEARKEPKDDQHP